jgi:hypothetical protein
MRRAAVLLARNAGASGGRGQEPQIRAAGGGPREGAPRRLARPDAFGRAQQRGPGARGSPPGACPRRIGSPRCRSGRLRPRDPRQAEGHAPHSSIGPLQGRGAHRSGAPRRAPRCARRPPQLHTLARRPCRALADPLPPARGLNGAPAEGQQQLGGALSAAARGMAGHGTPPAVVPNPLQQIVPPVGAAPVPAPRRAPRPCEATPLRLMRACTTCLAAVAARRQRRLRRQRQQQWPSGCARPAPRRAPPGTSPQTHPRPARAPQIIKGVKAGVDGIKNGVPAAVAALANSGMTRGAIAYSADNVSLRAHGAAGPGARAGRGRRPGRGDSRMQGRRRGHDARHDRLFRRQRVAHGAATGIWIAIQTAACSRKG